MRAATFVLSALSGVVCVLWPFADARAVDWQLSHAVTTRITFTDNVDLDPDSCPSNTPGCQEAEAAIVPSVTYSLNGTGQGNRMLFVSNSSVTGLYDSSDSNPQLDQAIRLFGRAELWSDRLFFDASLTSTQELVNANSRTSASGVSGQNQQDSVTRISVAPILQHHFGDLADGLVGFRHTEIFASGNTDDARANAAQATVASGNRFRFWKPGATAAWYDYNEDPAPGNSDDDIEQLSFQVDNDFQVSQRYRLLTTVGYDDVDTPSSSRDLGGVFFSVGAAGTPSARTQFSVRVGHRYDEIGVTGNVNHQLTGNLALNVSAGHGVGTALQQAGTQVQRVDITNQGTGVLTGPNGLPAGFIRSDLDDGVATIQSLGIGLVGNYGRNVVTVGGTVDRREFDSGKEYSGTFRGSINRSLSARMTLTLGAFYRYVDDLSGDDTHTFGERVDLNYQLGPRLSVFVGASRTDRFSADSREEYTENAVSLGGRVTF